MEYSMVPNDNIATKPPSRDPLFTTDQRICQALSTGFPLFVVCWGSHDYFSPPPISATITHLSTSGYRAARHWTRYRAGLSCATATFTSSDEYHHRSHDRNHQ